MGAITSMGSLDAPSDAVSLLTDTVSVSADILAEWVAGDATGILSVMLVTFWILLPQYWQNSLSSGRLWLHLLQIMLTIPPPKLVCHIGCKIYCWL